jgi:hypothetical protein
VSTSGDLFCSPVLAEILTQVGDSFLLLAEHLRAHTRR